MAVNRYTYKTEDGVVYPWEGPVGQYPKGIREPEIRSRVFVKYYNMGNVTERENMARDMTLIQNGSYFSLSDPVYTTPENGHTHVLMVYEKRFACDPDYEMENSSEVKVEENKEEEGAYSSKTVSEENKYENDDKEDNRSVNKTPDDALISKPIEVPNDAE